MDFALRKPRAHEDTRRGTGKCYSFQIPQDEYIRGMLSGNGDHSANGTRFEKLEDMQGSIVRRRMPTKLIRPVMLWGRNVDYNEETRQRD